jgi:glycosyltransferase involved in cell wall biosynthesis
MGSFKNICHLIASNFYGGPERQIMNHCSALSGSGFRPTIGTFQEKRKTVELIDVAVGRGIPCFSIETRFSLDLRMVGRLREKIENLGIDLLVAHGYKANITGHYAAKAARIPRIGCFRGYTRENLKVRLYQFIERRFIAMADRIVCVADAQKSFLTGLGIEEDRIVVIHNSFHEGGTESASVDLYEEFSIDRKDRIILSAGRLSPEKGHRWAILAMPEVLRRFPDTTLVILGEGQELGRLEALCRRSGIEGKVRFPGFRKGIVSYLRGADLLVNPSLSEGLPNIILEAVSAGTPVVATAVGGVPEMVADGETGYLCSPKDASSLAAAIIRALSGRAETEECRSKARLLLDSRFHPAAQLQKYLDLYRRFLPADSGLTSYGPKNCVHHR